MQIKLIPETDNEKLRFGDVSEVVHNGVNDYFIAGVKADEDNSSVDFHDWRGQYRFLLGSLQYFYEMINDERRQQEARRAMQASKPNAPNAPQAPQGGSQKATPNLQVIGNNVPEKSAKIVPAEIIADKADKVDKADKKTFSKKAESTEENNEKYEETND